MESLAEYLKTRKHKGFVPRPRYFPVGDYLTHFWSDKRCWSRRIDEHVTVYKAVDTGEIVGIKLKGFAKLATDKLEK